MRILICLLPLVVAAAPLSDSPPEPAAGKCPNAKPMEAKRDKPVTAHPLSQEPGARQEIAVLHYDANHCVKPIVVRDNVGSASK
jgi:hypothetical protein